MQWAQVALGNESFIDLYTARSYCWLGKRKACPLIREQASSDPCVKYTAQRPNLLQMRRRHRPTTALEDVQTLRHEKKTSQMERSAGPKVPCVRVLSCRRLQPTASQLV
ncbi:Hypothetical predicted protein [Xyrichtys novacula]|uniref:Uncharacterized protein n=1 Tax=Xyrichtys novacula TaxID=13765 RepID=A0AAV1H0E7_XYRNO|nr:Hypothetical predicted protein [Xyrichtys novacula]